MEASSQDKALRRYHQTPLRLFSVAAMLLVVSVVAGLALLVSSNERFSNSINAVDDWSSRLAKFEQLNPALVGVVEPADHVFVSRDNETEAAKLRAASANFRTQIQNLRAELAANPDSLTSLALQSLNEFEAKGLRVQQLSSMIVGQYSVVDEPMSIRMRAQMNGPRNEAIQKILELKGRVYQSQEKYIASQRAKARRAQQFAFVMGIAGLGVIAVIGLLGRRLSRLQHRVSLERYGTFVALKKSEAELRSFNRKLAESNRDLTDFAYVASHDLQEPLRKIIAFGDRLGKRFGDELGADGLDYLARMQSAAGRMQVLIEDLLTFSRVNTRGEVPVETDLNAVVQGVVSDLEVAIERAGATVEVGELPTLEVDPSQFRQLIQNLVGNALKFRRTDVISYVSIRASKLAAEESETLQLAHLAESAWWCIEVKDNGIGFEQKYADKIFTVFQRLHGRSEYEGSGVGLAVVRRIVERHGGQVAVVSVPGQGTTFSIHLPAEHVPSVLDDAGASASSASSADSNGTSADLHRSLQPA